MPDHAIVSSKQKDTMLSGRSRVFGERLSQRLVCLAAGNRENHARLRLVPLFFFLCAVALFYCSTANAAQVTLAWDPVQPAPEGYRLYSRTESGAYNYAAPVWTGTTSTCTINNLSDNTAYRFVVRAYVGGNQSGNSNEVRYTTPSPINLPPIANAGVDQSVISGAMVTLRGSGNDPEGQSLRFQWRQTGGTTVQLSNASIARPTFTAPTVTSGSTTLLFSLTVTDTHNASASDTCRVVVSAATANQPPVAEAGPNQIVLSSSQVTLNGSGSNDPEKQPLTYRWIQKSGVAVTLQNADTARPSFSAPQVTSFVQTLDFELRVTDPQGLSSSDTCLVMVTRRKDDDTNEAPISSGADSSTNRPPHRPTLVFPQADQTDVPKTLLLVATDFDDPDSDDLHLLTQWQIRRSDDQRLVMDLTCEMEPLNQLQVPLLILEPDTHYTGRMRYYDSRAEASPWSAEVSFSTGPCGMDTNGSGIPDAQEADPRADLNADGIPDNEQGSMIKTLKTAGGSLQIGVSIEASNSAVAIERATLQDITDLPDAPYTATEMPYGLLASKISIAEPGGETLVRFLYSDGLPANTRWLRHDPIWGWHECGAPVERFENGQIIERLLTDGGPDDADGIANGIIVDLAGPRFIIDAGLGGDAPSGSGGGGGCFIQSLSLGRWQHK
jgi:hypothetical protein